MPKSQLYQKTSLVTALSLIFFFVCVFHCANQTKVHTQTPNNIPIPSGYIGTFYVQNFETHMLLHGLLNSETKESIPLLLDTGSDLSFLAGETHVSDKKLLWAEKTYKFPVKTGILPAGIEGIVGHDFFQHTCIWWEKNQITVYDADSEVCSEPLAFFSTSLKLLETRRFESFYYIKAVKNRVTHWTLVDSGSSLTFLPLEFDPDSEALGNKKVYPAGGKVFELPHFQTKGPLEFATVQGNLISFFDFSFLGGISLEQLQITKDKDREAVWVIGLNLLRRVPIFWDFKRSRIGIYAQTDGIH